MGEVSWKELIKLEEFSAAFSKNGYSRPDVGHYNYFINGLTGKLSKIQTKREAAMLLSQVLHESKGLQATEEINPNKAHMYVIVKVVMPYGQKDKKCMKACACLIMDGVIFN